MATQQDTDLNDILAVSEIILRDFTSEVYPPNEVEQYLERVENVMTAFDILIDEYEYYDQRRANSIYRQLYSLWQSLQRSNLLLSRSYGRPRLLVNLELLELLLDCDYKLCEICNIVGVSRTTLWRLMRENDISVKIYTDISDTDLDSTIQSFKHDHPHCGLSLVQGHLLANNIKIQRRRIRESLRRVDPLGVNFRRQHAIHRRVYRVPGPNSLWHIDGHHSLIRWRMVLHGGIDGFSRMIVFLHCSTNNRSETVFNLFNEAIKKFNVPSRVRSDKGGENIRVCEFMISYRGIGRASHIAGASVHNQRIERLWRDVFRCVCVTYHTLFYEMEGNGLLDPTSEIDLFALHYVFLPKVNSTLYEFTEAWNNHTVRTERNRSPRKIWLDGVLDPNNREQIAIRDIIDELPFDSFFGFGIDSGGPLSCESDNYVEVPETQIPGDLDITRLEEEVEPLLNIGNEDPVDLYLFTKALLLNEV